MQFHLSVREENIENKNGSFPFGKRTAFILFLKKIPITQLLELHLPEWQELQPEFQLSEQRNQPEHSTG